jgi:DNA-binding beta-propeller fold protein YncE
MGGEVEVVSESRSRARARHLPPWRPAWRASVLALAAAACLLTATVALAATGQITQLPGTAGCVSVSGSGGACTVGRGFTSPESVAASPDGKSVYAAADGVATFERDTTSGALTQLPGPKGCIVARNYGGCDVGHSLDGARSVAVSPDGKNVYVAAGLPDQAVTAFKRDIATGELTQLPASGIAGCVSQSGSEGCIDGKGLGQPTGMAVSPDGKNVYVASYRSDAVAVLQRNTTTGALTQDAGGAGAGCVREGGGVCRNGRALECALSVAVSPDGKNVYVSSSSAVAVFQRNASTGALWQLRGTAGCVSESGNGGACADGKALESGWSAVVSPDGNNLYVATTASSAIAVFRRNATTGTITQLVGPTGKAGCVSESGTEGACADGKGLYGAQSVAASPDGKSVYAASNLSEAVAVFRRDAGTGVLTQLAGRAGCVTQTGSDSWDPTTVCSVARPLEYPRDVTLSPDNRNVYVAVPHDSAIVSFARETPP